MADYDTLELGDVRLLSGDTLHDAKLVYKTYGKLNAQRNNAIVFPAAYGGRHTDNEQIIREGMALDPTRYFIVVPNMFGNGLSSSPSNTPPPFDRARFPRVSIYDNVVCQHRLVTEQLGVRSVAMVTGWSMGALQTNQWAVLYPDMVERILPYCGSARTSRHNQVFLEGVRAALTADAAFQSGWYDEPPAKGLRAMGRVYAGWAVSQAYYREEVYLSGGYSSIEDYLVAFWEGRMLQRDANNLLAMLWTWQNADASANPKYCGDFAAAMGAVRARAIVMPGQTDLYFPPEDNEYEVSLMPNAELRPIPSIWGHMAGAPGLNPDDAAFLDRAMRELLAS